MTAKTFTQPTFTSQIVNGLLSIKPLANFAKSRARSMMIERAERLGVPWRKRFQEYQQIDWAPYLSTVQNLQLPYPDYYLRAFHAYENGNLSWDAAWEVESAAYSVHSGIWKDANPQGDAKLRQSYHDFTKILKMPLINSLESPRHRIDGFTQNIKSPM